MQLLTKVSDDLRQIEVYSDGVWSKWLNKYGVITGLNMRGARSVCTKVRSVAGEIPVKQQL